MSTRATVSVEYKNNFVDSFYKHHDGYIKGGLGELLMNFVSVCKTLDAENFLADFKDFVENTEINSVEVTEMEKINASENSADLHRLHGDTEYHYTICPSKFGWALLVQRRDYDNGFQNGTENTKTGHWTDFASNEMLGFSGTLYTQKLA
jgi:hypothetical protein